MKRITPLSAPRSAEPSQEEIAALAYHLYLENGCREGRHLEDWFRAEKMLRERARNRALTQKPKPRPTPRADASPALVAGLRSSASTALRVERTATKRPMTV